MSRQDAPELSISEAIELYIRRKRPDWNGGTERTYRRNLELFVEYAAENELDELDTLSRWDVGGFTDWLLEQDYAAATVASRQKTVRTWLKYLESQGLVEHGLHTAIETLRLDDEEETSDQQLAPEDAQELLAFYRDSAEWRGTRRHAILEVLWHVGCRMAGLRALDLGDYDAESGDPGSGPARRAEPGSSVGGRTSGMSRSRPNPRPSWTCTSLASGSTPATSTAASRCLPLRLGGRRSGRSVRGCTSLPSPVSLVSARTEPDGRGVSTCLGIGRVAVRRHARPIRSGADRSPGSVT